MFESIGNFFGGIKNFFVDTYHTVKNGIVGVYDKITGVTSNVVNTVYSDIKGGISGAGNIINNVVDSGKNVAHDIIGGTKDVITHGQDTLGNIGQSFSWPLTIVAGIVGFYYLSKR